MFSKPTCLNAHRRNPDAPGTDSGAAGPKLGLTTSVLLGGLLGGALGCTMALPVGPDDVRVGPLTVGQDTLADVQKWLGRLPCHVRSRSGETVSYLYDFEGPKGRYYVRLELAGQQVEAITLSIDPPLSGVCYAPEPVDRPPLTGRGLELGASLQQVLDRYGEPAEQYRVGRFMRLRYRAVLDSAYEWDLLFKDDRLTEWTVVTDLAD